MPTHSLACPGDFLHTTFEKRSWANEEVNSTMSHSKNHRSRAEIAELRLIGIPGEPCLSAVNLA